MRRVLRFASLLFCLAFALQLAAQDSDSPSSTTTFGLHRKSMSYTVRGNLRDTSTNRGAEGVKVELHEEGGATVSTTFTGTAGEFTFSNVGSGTYEISVLQIGYQPIDQQISVEDSVFGVQLLLRKATDQPGGKSATVSVRELSIPRKAHEYMLKGVNLLYQKSDYRGSIDQFQRATKEYPGYYEAYGQMAVAYLNLNDTANAEDSLKKSIDASQQRYADAYFALAGLYVDDQRFADAEPIARKSTELDDSSWKGHFELACALFGLDRAAEAETEAKAAADRQPEDAQTRLLLANIHIRLRNYPAVTEDLDAYLKIEPNGEHADQARQTRDQIQDILQKAQSESGQEDAPGADDGAPGDQTPNADAP
jgi:thioredoxin-like negative regulator of GroEL